MAPEIGTSASADEGIGRRIARKRRARGLTQQGLAERAFVSRSLIQQVETGNKPATPSLVATVAAALHVDPAEVYGQPYRGVNARTDRAHASIPDLRRALSYMDFQPDLDTPPRPLDTLASEVATLRRLSHAGRDVQVGARVSAVLAELTVRAHETQHPQAWSLLNATHAIAASLARHLGYTDLASLGIERASAAAARSDDENLPRLAQLSRALLMMTIGEWGQGLKLVRNTSQVMNHDTTASQAVYGALQLRAAILSARAGNTGDAWEHHSLAAEVAQQLPAGLPDYYGMQFHPANVDIHGVAVAVELTDFDEAIRRDARLSLSSRRLTAERRAHHEIDICRALVSTRKFSQALRRISRAERIAPHMVRYHPMARETTRRLVDHHRTLPEPLRGLQDRMELS